jgi:hypothetical protein
LAAPALDVEASCPNTHRAIGPALDGAGLAEAAGVPVLMAAWAAAVLLIDRWVVRQR